MVAKSSGPSADSFSMSRVPKSYVRRSVRKPGRSGGLSRTAKIMLATYPLMRKTSKFGKLDRKSRSNVAAWFNIVTENRPEYAGKLDRGYTRRSFLVRSL